MITSNYDLIVIGSVLKQVENAGMATSIFSFSINFFVMPTSKAEESTYCVAKDLRTGGPWFNPRLAQYSFQVLMIVIAT